MNMPAASKPFPDNLTAREAEVVEAFILTGSYKGAAQRLGLQVCTINDHMAAACGKAGLRHRVQMVARYVAVKGHP